MFELPECMILARQMNETIKGKTIWEGLLGNSPHRFVWYNRSHNEFGKLARGKKIGKVRTQGKWLFIPLEPGYVLLIGECGGKILYHPSGSYIPERYHLLIGFIDGSSLSAMTQMWGAFELYEKGKERERQYVKGMRTTPVEPEFTFDYFSRLIEDISETGKRSVKGLLIQDQIIPGLGNAIAQDILFRARLHPRHSIDDLSKSERRVLFDSILKTLHEVVRKGGRNDEFDLYGNTGKYKRIMDKNAAGAPCPECGKKVEKIQYLGGTCYFCPHCQK